MDDFEKLCHIGKNVSRETFLTLCLYRDHLLTWNRQTNLIARGDTLGVWERHFLDSAQLCPYLESGASEGPIVDLGSGAGFPGLVISLLLNRPVLLVESDLKKVIFLREMIRLTGACASVYHGRIEGLHIEPGHVLISRALASLNDLVSFGLLLRAKKGYFLKGARAEEEMAKLTHIVSGIHLHPGKLKDEARIVEVVF